MLGAPFDLAVTYRPGTRFGPRAVRQAEDVGVDGRPSIELGIDPYEALKVVDYGDADAPAERRPRPRTRRSRRASARSSPPARSRP